MEALLDISRRETCRLALLLHLFVFSAAAQCLRPEVGENWILTEETLLKNDFPEGSEATLECDNGYEKKNGSVTINCINGKWSESDIVCKKKDCGPPPPEPHMTFDDSEGTLFGSKVRTLCEEGYRISGSSFRHCYASGWFGRGSCNIVTCPIPTEVENGTISWESDKKPEYGQIINFTCNPGYRLNGSERIMCSKTGKYDPLPPTCIGVTTEDSITTKIITSSAATTKQVSTSTPRPKPVTTLASMRSSTQKQDNRSSLPKRTAGTTILPYSTSSVYKDQNLQTINVNKSNRHLPVIVSVILVTIVGLIFIFMLNKCLDKRKGLVGTGPNRYG
ncbi:PREDICTED: complement factor H-like isoform X2 [Cyprinodon variegatus]|uniref:complement factor H-like isoform X2 n=1 Tax=Cyprinodon variegatus TaxID=28743 RepID=UPI000742B2CC|nr:PREDICTED: complement factor H-like isoform X2 [Cyprinodon variegatus]